MAQAAGIRGLHPQGATHADPYRSGQGLEGPAGHAVAQPARGAAPIWRESRPEGWLFPGEPKISPLSPRQLNRTFTSAKFVRKRRFAQEKLDRLSQNLVRGVAEGPLGSAVQQHDLPDHVRDDDAVPGRRVASRTDCVIARPCLGPCSQGTFEHGPLLSGNLPAARGQLSAEITQGGSTCRRRGEYQGLVSGQWFTTVTAAGPDVRITRRGSWPWSSHR
jgi:hypothetical protein